MDNKPQRLTSPVLAGTALFAMAWVVARSHVQAITIDEADTYLFWAGRSTATYWQGATNNHLLNSMLMRLFTGVFGVSHLSIRAPALIGAALYIFAAFRLCSLLTGDHKLQWALLVCVVYNPFIQDYLVAARGYSLAMGLCLSAMAVLLWFHCEREEGRADRMLWACFICSILASLSFAANFSFAFVDAAVALTAVVLACKTYRTGAGSDPAPSRAIYRGRVLVAVALPALAVMVFLVLPLILTWPGGELTFGAASLGETARTLIRASFYELNPYLVNPVIYKAVERLRVAIPPLLAALCLTQLGLVAYDRRYRSAGTLNIAWAGVLLAVPLSALFCHWLAFKLFHVLLPKDRTAMYLVPLVTLGIGAIAGIPVRLRGARRVRSGLLVTLAILGAYFVMCLRLRYFKEWKFDADVERAYSIVSYYNHEYGVADVPVSWLYRSSLNFYRTMSGRESLEEFRFFPNQPPAGKDVYVLNYPDAADFISAQRLKTIYHGELSDLVVVIQPALAHKRPGPRGF